MRAGDNRRRTAQIPVFGLFHRLSTTYPQGQRVTYPQLIHSKNITLSGRLADSWTDCQGRDLTYPIEVC